jgi:N-acyl-D-amino-acid deacylase
MGTNYKRVATLAEVQAMQALLAADMKAGSLGFSTGLEYDPGIYSARDEVLALAGTAKAGGGTYMSHIRSEDVAFDDAIDEILEIGAKTGIPVQISHLKLGIVDRWGQAKAVLAKLDAARARGIKVTADVYPYEYWQSSLSVLFPKRDFTDPSYVGKTIADIAALRGEEPAVTYLWLINNAQAWKAAHPESTRVESVIGTAMAPADIADFLAWKHSNLCSDGGIGGLHPRGYGAFGRMVRVYVRETGRLTLAEAIHKMTGLSAEHLGLKTRGLIRPGMKADLVLFDPDRFADKATVQSPNALAVGMNSVIIGGAVVYRDGKPTGAYPGQFLKRGQD